MIQHFLQTVAPSLEHIGAGGYWVAFFAALLETIIGIGLILPGSTLILLLGAMSGRGYFDVGDLLWFAIAGAVIGDNVNYYLGKRFGTKWRVEGVWFLKGAHLEKGKRFMDAHGAKSVFLGRFVPTAKEVVPFIAGSVGMRKGVFFFWNLLGGIGWGLQFVLVGYFFAQALNVAEFWLSRVGLFLAILFVIFAILYLLKWLMINKGPSFLDICGSLFRSVKQAVLENEHVARWMKSHPRMVSFFRARLDPAYFPGLPLTILAVVFGYVLALLGGIVEDFVTSDPIVSLDVRIANLLASFRSDSLTTVFRWITVLGKWEVVVVFFIISALFLRLWRKSVYTLPLLASIIGSDGFTYLGKIAFHRPRPDTALYVEHSYSFPSGHATIATAFYGFICYMLVRGAASWKRKINLIFLGAILILAIGLSRIYLGVHYLSDVWSGYLVGTLWLITTISIAEWLEYKKSTPTLATSLRFAQPVSIGLAVAAIGFYAGFAMHYHPLPAPVKQETPAIVSDALSIFSTEQAKYTRTLFGGRQEPINFIFSADSDLRLQFVFRKAGWTKADSPGFSSLGKVIDSYFQKRSYPAPPVSPSFWERNIQNFSFEKSTGGRTVGHSRRIRIWRTNAVAQNGNRIYAGMANATDGFSWGIVPKISPDLNETREFVFHDLKQSGFLSQSQKTQLVDAQIGNNFLGAPFFTDGKAYIVSIR